VLPRERIDSAEFRWSDLRPNFFEGFHRTIPALVAARNDLIGEHIIETRQWMDRLIQLLAGHDVFFVGVHCPLDELVRREAARGDRRIGEAETDFSVLTSTASTTWSLMARSPATYRLSALLRHGKIARPQGRSSEWSHAESPRERPESH